MELEAARIGVQTVAILSPGDMGHAIGRTLRRSGLEAITYLAGRSQRTRDLAAQAGIRDMPTLEQLVLEADLILSILVPAEAVANAERSRDRSKRRALTRPTPTATPSHLPPCSRLPRSSRMPEARRSMHGLVGVPGKASRWVGEMEEIAGTFASVGLTPRLHLGAADVFRMIAESSVGHERPETVDHSRTPAELIAILAASLKAQE